MTVPASANSAQPVIGRAAGIELTAAQVALLQKRFAAYTEIFAEQSFHSGYSGAAVYLISRDPDAPVVVKFAHPFDLQREVTAYHELVERTAPQNTARLQGDLLASADGQLGLIVYTFAGGNLHTGANSFGAFFQSHGGQAAARVFDQLLGSYGRQWWASNELRRLVYAEEYDRLLPVQLVLRAHDARPTDANPILIRAGTTSSLLVRQLQPGQWVQLEGLAVVKAQAGQLTLYAEPPPGERSAPLRLRLELPAGNYRPGDLLPPQTALVQSTRWELLAASAQAALPTFDDQQEHFTVDQVAYSNPLHALAATLDRAQDLRVSIVHGDLNLQNILVDPASTFAWLIDFAETHRGPTLFDLQRMEVQVIAKLLPTHLPRPQTGATLLASLFDSLHTATPTLISPVPTWQEPYRLLVTLREWARQFLVDDRQWAEYYRGLLLALTGALKFDELEPAARLLVLVGAAKARELIDKPLATPADPAPGPSPYKGLQAFDLADAELFFGREALIRQLLNHIQQEPFLAIVGPSGSGKSSLVRAGLGAALASQPTWQVTLITPTAQPLANLTRALAQPAPVDQRWLLVVDQFEEIFTLCRDKNERQRFVNHLLTAAGLTDPALPPRATVLITLRADFYADCAEFAGLRAALARWQTYIGPLSPAELRRAIAEPAQRNGWAIEPDLIELLLRDVGNEPGALPLLAQALLETWNRRRGRLLTVAGYVASGSVQGAIARTAETVYKERLLPEQQPVARQIFLELTEIGESGQNTRRRVTQPDLLARAGDPPQTQAVIDTLAQARLITVAEKTVEVAHEALIREWPMLQAWIEADRAALRLHRQLTQAAQEWEQLGHDDDLLYRGVRLEQVVELQVAGVIRLNSLEKEFIASGVSQRDHEAEARERQRQVELKLAQERAALAEAQTRRQNRRIWWLRRIAILLGVLLLLPIALGVLQWRRSHSRWKFAPNFPKNPVISLALAPSAPQQNGYKLCAATDDLGLGCTQDGSTWNIYQQNLPTVAADQAVGDLYPNTVWSIQAVAFDSQDEQRLFMLVASKGLYSSINQGMTWTPRTPGLIAPAAARRLAVMGRWLFVTTKDSEYGLYFSHDDGDHWEKLNGNGVELPEQAWSIEIDPVRKKLYVGGQDGLYSSNLALPWQWQQEAHLATVEDLAPVAGEPGAYYIATYDDNQRNSAIYQLHPGQPLQPEQPLARVAGRIMVLAAYPGADRLIATYALVCNRIALGCSVLAIRPDGKVESRGNRPLWWDSLFSYDLLVLPPNQGSGVQLLLGHQDGLVVYQEPP